LWQQQEEHGANRRDQRIPRAFCAGHVSCPLNLDGYGGAFGIFDSRSAQFSAISPASLFLPPGARSSDRGAHARE
jgi:hypothetical protein